MTKTDQHRIVTELINSVSENLFAKIASVPEEWDGIELRQWVADTFNDESTQPRLLNGKRLKDYRNTIATTTL